MLIVWLASVLLTVIVHLAFAFAVGKDAGNLPRNRKPYFAGKTIWFLGVLLGGPLLAGVYWIMHHSTICPFVYVACKEEIDFNHQDDSDTNST